MQKLRSDEAPEPMCGIYLLQMTKALLLGQIWAV